MDPSDENMSIILHSGAGDSDFDALVLSTTDTVFGVVFAGDNLCDYLCYLRDLDEVFKAG